MRVFVDADACPVVGIIEKVAREHNVPVTLLCDTNHVLFSDYSEVIVVGAGADAVDYKLIGICHKGDICCIAGLWSGSNGTWKRCICDSSIWEMVYQ